MKVTTSDGRLFTMTAESDTDLQLLAAINFVHHIEPVRWIGTTQEAGGWSLTGYELRVDHNGPGKLVADASRQALRCLGDLFRIGLREAADHGHVRADAADPQPQEALAASLVQIQAVTQTLSAVVGQLEVMRQEGGRAHVISPDASLHAQGSRV